jgi:hypothetical protein
VRSKGSWTEFFYRFPSNAIYRAAIELRSWKIDVSVVAVVVKTERLALTFVVILCQCRGMDVKEEQRVASKFCCKVDFSATKTVELIQKAYGD